MPPARFALWLASAVILGMALVAAAGGPVLPVGALVGVACGYGLLLALGSLSPRLEMYGDVLWRVPEARGLFSLTFDDGPEPSSTSRVLDVLRERGARATFFVLGGRAERHPELLARMVAEGHSIGLHSYDHDRLYAFLRPEAVRADIERCRDAIERACGVRPIWFRPPVGQLSPRTVAGVERARAVVVGWSTRGRDGLWGTTPEDVLERVAPRLEAGAIVLLHDAWERPAGAPAHGPAGVAALPRLLDEASRRGLQAVTLEELLASGSQMTKHAPGA